MLKILLISGHGASDPGACSNYGIERDETRRVVNRLKQLLANYMTVTVYPQDRNCYADVVNGTVQVNMSAFDYVFEVHFNSGVSKAHGTEIWVTPQEDSTKVEQGIVNKVAALGFTNRGVKSEQFAVINYAKRQGVSSALIETCFISNQSDMNTYRSKFNEICSSMAKGIVEGFGMTYRENTTVKPQETKGSKIEYKAMVQDVGWQPVKSNGQTAGTTGQKKRLEALWIKYTGKGKLTFSSHIQNIGWTSDRTSGEITGTVDIAYRMEAIKMKLEGSDKKIQYRVHVEGTGWTKWYSNDEVAGTTGQGKRIEAIEIKLQ